MKRIILAVLVAVMAWTSISFADSGFEVKVEGINFTKDGNNMRIVCKLINRTGRNVRLDSVTFGKFHFWEEDVRGPDRLDATTTLKYTDLNIYIKDNHYVEHTFTLSVTGNGRRYFKGEPRFEYYYKVSYTSL